MLTNKEGKEMWTFEKNVCEKIDKEQWKICTYPDVALGLYSISSYGRIKNNKTGKILIPFNLIRNRKQENVYAIIKLKFFDKEKGKLRYKNFRLHRLVAWEYCEHVDGMNIVEHINDNKLDNYYRNLKWSNQGENTRNAIKTGRLKIDGENNINSKYKEKFIRSICSMMEEGKTNKEILYIIAGNDATIRKNPKEWSLICHLRSKDRFTSIACQYKYKPVFHLTDTDKIIIGLIIQGYQNLDIMKKYGYETTKQNTALYSQILKCRKIYNICSTTRES